MKDVLSGFNIQQRNIINIDMDVKSTLPEDD